MGCECESNKLPQSGYFESIPKQGINRNIYLQIRNYKLFSNNEEIKVISDLSENLQRYVDLNDGSNSFTIIINASSNCSGTYIDSILSELNRNLFFKTFLLTNEIKDSVGIKNFTHPIDVPLPKIEKSQYDSVFRNFRVEGQYFSSRDSVYPITELENKLSELIKSGKFLEVFPYQQKNYGDFVVLVSKYNMLFENHRDKISIERFNKPYDTLDEFEKFEIRPLTRKGMTIRLKDQIQRITANHSP